MPTRRLVPCLPHLNRRDFFRRFFFNLLIGELDMGGARRDFPTGFFQCGLLTRIIPIVYVL